MYYANVTWEFMVDDETTYNGGNVIEHRDQAGRLDAIPCYREEPASVAVATLPIERIVKHYRDYLLLLGFASNVRSQYTIHVESLSKWKHNTATIHIVPLNYPSVRIIYTVTLSDKPHDSVI